MTARHALLLITAGTSMACATTAMPAHVSITSVAVGFISDRRSSDRRSGQAATSDLLFFDVEVANPDPREYQAAVVCIRTDDVAASVKHQITLQARSRKRHRIMGLSALPIAFRLRCRLEPATAELPPSEWTDLMVPANDTTLSSPI